MFPRTIRKTIRRDVHQSGDTSLHMAAEAGGLPLVKDLVERGTNVHAKDRFGKTPLHHAGSAEVAKHLVEKGADVHAKDQWGNTPLHYAAQVGDLQLVKYLIDAGAVADAQNGWYKTPLHHADSAEVVEYLINHIAKVNAENDRKMKEAQAKEKLAKNFSAATSSGPGVLAVSLTFHQWINVNTLTCKPGQ